MAIRRLASGNWQAVANYRDATGRNLQLSETHPTAKEAKAAHARLLLRAQKQSQISVLVPKTMGDLLDLWWRVQEPKLSPTTVVTTRGIVNKHIRPAFATLKPSQLTPYRVEAFYSKLPEMSDSNRSGIHRTLHKILADALRWEWIEKNPAAQVHPPSVPQREVTLPTAEQVDRIIVTADNLSRAPWFGTFLRLSITTGCRRGELCGLKWGDIDWDAQTIRIDESVSYADGEVSVRLPKTRSSMRTMRLGADTLGKLHLYRESLLSIQCGADRFLFSRGCDHSSPLIPQYVTALWKLVRKAHPDLDVRLRLHDLRHTNLTWLVNSGLVPITTASHRAGHSRTSTTHDVYTHRDVAGDSEAADFLDSLLK